MLRHIKGSEKDLLNWFMFESQIDPDVIDLSNGEKIGYRWTGEPKSKTVILLIHG